jgi:hypothetical protein
MRCGGLGQEERSFVHLSTTYAMTAKLRPYAIWEKLKIQKNEKKTRRSSGQVVRRITRNDKIGGSIPLWSTLQGFLFVFIYHGGEDDGRDRSEGEWMWNKGGAVAGRR